MIDGLPSHDDLARPARLTRRAVLNAWLAAPVLLSLPLPARSQGSRLDPTPACGDTDMTPPQTEGPFYTSGTPSKRDFRVDGAGQPINLFGFVVDRDCRPQRNVLIDLWHADDAGAYDNSGFRFRGHQVTDAEGRFIFETILPGEYPGRTRHYHVKLAANRQVLLTTQLYFPDDPGNSRDFIFDPRLVMAVSNASDGTMARFDFVV
jgi:protocatechuate 3,4-dioxygenase beta subunit